MFDTNQCYKKCSYNVGISSKDFKFYLQACSLSVNLQINLTLRPVIEVGLVDITLEVQSIDFDPTANAGGVVSGIVKVVGHELGLKMICIDSFAQPK